MASQRNIVYADLDAHTIHTVDPVVGGMMVSSSGEVTLPEVPGLGVDIDPAFLKTLKRV
jgi:L-alanine-DL-glutamate epimerase-like enolase superfamily enzyme